LSLLSACQREKDAAPAASQPLSIEEAKSWFDSHLGASGSPSGRTAKKPAREPDWPYAYKQKIKDKELVVVPLKLEKGYRSKGYLGKLLMFKDAEGNVQTQVVKASGTKAFLEKNNYNVHGEGFSGIVRVEDWDGKLIDGEYYDNGKVVGRLGEGSTSKGGRTQGYYITVIVYFYQQVCMGSDCGDWTPLDAQPRYIYINDGYSPSYYYGTYYYSSGGSTGTGGSTSTCPYGPNCNEPVPFDEQTFDIEVVQPVDWLKFISKVNTYLNPCDAYRDLINSGYANNNVALSRELGGIEGRLMDQSNNPTGSNVFIAYPVSSLDVEGGIKFNWRVPYLDSQGREILAYPPSTGDGYNYVRVTTYAGPGSSASVKVYRINTMVHTHPFDAGNPYTLPLEPSPADLQIARDHPHLKHRIVSRDQIIDFNGVGVTARQVNNCR
jgi:hypothetical protein